MSRVLRNLNIVLGASVLVVSLGACGVGAVATDDDTGARIVKLAANDNRAMQHLGYLVNEIGARPADSYEALVAYRWAQDEFRGFGLANVHLELVGEIEGYFPDDATSARYRQLYQTMFDKEPDLERVPIFNVIADLPGADLPYEYVIVGGHLDSTAQGDGATDNGTGVAAIMEAARLLVESGAQPRRTIRFILFGGEEVGLVGSRAYVEDHPDMIPATSAVYVLDRGTDYISGILATKALEADLTRAFEGVAELDSEMPFNIAQVDYLPRVDPNCGAPASQMVETSEGGRRVVTGGCGSARGASSVPEAPAAGDSPPCSKDGGASESRTDGMVDGKPAGRRLVMVGPDGMTEIDESDLESLGITPEMLADGNGMVRKTVVMGTSDHAPFLAAGIPAFFMQQEGTPGLAYPAHTAEDTLDHVVAEFVEHSAAVLALGALGTANIDHMLSRERLEAPSSENSSGPEQLVGISPPKPDSAPRTGASIPG
jgi:hypothetical protein